MPGVDRNYQFNELIIAQGGLTPLLFAVRQGYAESTDALLNAGADVNQPSAGDGTSPLLMAVINGHFDIAKTLIDKGAKSNAASQNGVTPLYGVLNVEWAPKALYPQPRAHMQQKTRLSRSDEAAARQGRRPERAPQDEGLVFGLQLRLVGRRRDRRHARSGAPPTRATSPR